MAELQATARVMCRPLSYDNKSIAVPKELLVDYKTGNVYVCKADGTFMDISESIGDIVMKQIEPELEEKIQEVTVTIDGTDYTLQTILVNQNTSINNINKSVSKNTTDIATNTSNIAKNATAISKNTTDIASNTTKISKNTENISKNADAISKNSKAITDNTTNITNNTNAISTNTSNIAKNTTAINSEVTRAKAAESANADAAKAADDKAAAAQKAVTDEVTRAKAAEKTNADNIAKNTTAISNEVTRAKAAEKANADGVASNKTNINNLFTYLGYYKDGSGNVKFDLLDKIVDYNPDTGDITFVFTTEDITETNNKQFVSATEKEDWNKATYPEIIKVVIPGGESKWTGTDAPYTQKITVSNIKATDVPVVDISLGDIYETIQKELDSYAYIYKILTYNGYIMVYASKPTEVDITIQMKVDR